MTPTPVQEGFLGIDIGTQGLSVIFTDSNAESKNSGHLKVLASGEASYDFLPGRPEGCYEQLTADWDEALSTAMKQLSTRLDAQKNSSSSRTWKILAIGISGQMHGEVLVGHVDGKQDAEMCTTATTANSNSISAPVPQALAPVRLWCDARNADTGAELTARYGTKVPKRATCARFLWTARNRPELAAQTRHLTTPAGWCAFRLTGEWNLGIGDGSGMFPMDPISRDYDATKLEQFDKLVNNPNIPSLASLLPAVRCAGQDAGNLSPAGAALLGVEYRVGIPVAPAEGDQVAALAGSLIGRAGTISCSFGTSVCANAVGDHPFAGVSPAVDQFCQHDGTLVNMVWLRNGTTFLNTMIESYGSSEPGDDDDSRKKRAFSSIMPQLIAAPPDCGGLLALPFMDDEPGLQVEQGGSALILGWNVENATPGNACRAALLATMFNLKLGCRELERQGYPRTEMVLTGGLSKTPECGQILADVFDTPVKLLESADEGSSWGAAIMAKYRYLCSTGSIVQDWPSFLESAMPPSDQIVRYTPNQEVVAIYERMFERYQILSKLQSQLTAAVTHV
jgi:sugar (pentulose or hexulose) kinase